MSQWFEVFDNEQVQLLTRKQAAGMFVVPLSVLGVGLLLLILSREGHLGELLAGSLIFPAWLFTLAFLVRRILRLRRLVWCLKLSDTLVAGYDYARRQTCMPWSEVQRIDLTAGGLVIEGSEGRVLELSPLFTDFAALSHRVVQYAEQHGIPVYVDGRPWEEVDVYRLFPFLEEGLPPSPPHEPSR